MNIKEKISRERVFFLKFGGEVSFVQILRAYYLIIN